MPFHSELIFFINYINSKRCCRRRNSILTSFTCDIFGQVVRIKPEFNKSQDILTPTMSTTQATKKKNLVYFVLKVD